jgi:peptidyl-prolyl cis-trans isomerase A (cyclophilin A)
MDQKSRLLVLLFVCMMFGCSQTKYKEPTIKIETNFGDILVELYPEKAPETVKAFLSYVDSGFYKNSSFYRVLKAEDQPSSAFRSDLIQGGIWQANYKKQQRLSGIPLETTQKTGLLHTNGVISLARTSANSGNTEFFICIGDQRAYDYGGSANSDGQGFAAFGKVIKGMEFVKQIHEQPDINTTFTPPILIKNIKKL